MNGKVSQAAFSVTVHRAATVTVHVGILEVLEMMISEYNSDT